MTKIEVQPGQVWKDNDPRSKELYLYVEATVMGGGKGFPRARCLPVQRDGDEWAPVLGGRPTEIRLSRFKPTTTGYTLVVVTATLLPRRSA